MERPPASERRQRRNRDLTMTGLTESLLNMFLVLGILVYIIDILSSVSFSTDEEDEDEL